MIVFSENCLREVVEQVSNFTFSTTQSTVLGDDLAIASHPPHVLFYHRSDSHNSRLVMVTEDPIRNAEEEGPLVVSRLLERLDRASREFWDPPVSLPTAWHKYQTDNRLAFFALPRRLNTEASRWIAERLTNDDLVFWKLTSRSDEETLESFIADYELPKSGRVAWQKHLDSSLDLLPAAASGPTLLQPSIDLQVVGSRAITRQRSYSVWLNDMSDEQVAVLKFNEPRALKVRGPAATGKTLTLQMKALHEIYQAIDDGSNDFRVLYLTHSWSLAEQVQASLSIMDERNVGKSIDIVPIAWLREMLHTNLPEGIEILGDDSVDGKKRQLRLVTEIIDTIRTNDWATFRATVSESIAEGVESESGSAERTALCWDLMREFNEVIDAYRLKPGVDSLRRYLGITREPWMVSLPKSEDLEFVFTVYREFVALLVEEGQLTTDQALDDLRRYLESYEWNLRRVKDGYDLVIVDEFHLFNDTERYLAHLLTKEAETAPRMVLALDPFQSAYTLLTGLEDGHLSRAAVANLPDSGPAESLDLLTVHRFTKRIYEFVRLVHSSFPNLVELGADWTFDFSSTRSGEPTGEIPTVISANSPIEAAEAAMKFAIDLNANTPAEERTAVIATGLEELQALTAVVEGQPWNTQRAVVLVEGRDDVEQLNYSRRSVIVSTAEFVAGLQFSNVVCVFFQADASGRSDGISAHRATLSNLYLAATRAERTLTLATTGSSGPLHEVVLKALAQGVVVRHPG